MEEPAVGRTGAGGVIQEHESDSIATNLHRSRSIPEPIIDPNDIKDTGMRRDNLQSI